MSTTTRVLLIDDHPLFREGLAGAIQAELGFEVVGQAGSVDELRRLAPQIEPDVAIVDLLMPSVSGIGVTRELCELLPRCRVLGLSAVVDAPAVAEMPRARASGVPAQNQPASRILHAGRPPAARRRHTPPSG